MSSPTIQQQLAFVTALQEGINEKLLDGGVSSKDRESMDYTYQMLGHVFSTLHALKGLREATGG